MDLKAGAPGVPHDVVSFHSCMAPEPASQQKSESQYSWSGLLMISKAVNLFGHTNYCSYIVRETARETA